MRLLADFRLDNTQIEIVSDILEYLFRNDRDKANAIYSLRDYYKYFMYRLDDKVLTVDELMSLAEKDDAEMIKSANQLYIRKYGLEFENQIGELLAQIYKNNAEGRTFDYNEIYNLLEKLTKSNIRGLRDVCSSDQIGRASCRERVYLCV